MLVRPDVGTYLRIICSEGFSIEFVLESCRSCLGNKKPKLKAKFCQIYVKYRLFLDFYP